MFLIVRCRIGENTHTDAYIYVFLFNSTTLYSSGRDDATICFYYSVSLYYNKLIFYYNIY